MRLTLPFLNQDAKKKPAKKGATKKSRIAAEGRRAARRRARARWLKPTLKIGVPVSVAGALSAAAFVLWSNGSIQRAYDDTVAKVMQVSAEMGLAVYQVSVSGRRETNKDRLLQAVGVQVGDPILAVDIQDVLKRVNSIGWVEAAVVERRLPDHIHIHIQEREAAAIWQKDHEFVLVDIDGNIIGTDGLERYRHLKVVVGDGAPERTAELVTLLEREPMLDSRIVAAVWVAGRRWNLRLDNGIDIRLPEENPGEALQRLAQLERDHRLLARDIAAIDLRQSDRLIVRMTEEAAERKRAHKDET
ncbi:cell division protein FtsQ/DivIB [Hwanghaeella sp.]|uniref:cell division protein FtsQ/DivIB n=1 Tax=Hwanghaeella sp. TaxID=2605943 RepID=UPI003CCBF2AD